MTIIVHHLEQSRSQRILWLLEELGLPYEVKHYKRDAKTRMADPAYKAVHPLGKAPTIEDDGVVLPETGAIFEYLIDKAGGALRPAAGTPERLRFLFWMHYPEGSIMPIIAARYMMMILPAAAPEAARAAVQAAVDERWASLSAPSLKTHMDYWEAELGRANFLAGNAFTAADIMMEQAVSAAASIGAFEGRPKLKAWYDGLKTRPAYARALERGKA